MSTSSNMVLIETKTVGAGGSSTIEFTGIPQTGYTDLQLVVSARFVSDVNESILIALNGSTANFSGRYLQGNGASAASGTITRWIGSADDSAFTSNTFSNTTAYFPNYAGSTNKSFSSDSVMENNGSTAYQDLGAGLWSNTAAITSITLSGAANFAEGSTASLYGIKSLAKVKASGGNIYRINGYIYHEFKASGTFTPVENISNVEYLVIAGGGGGGGNVADGDGAGGGGSGGYRSSVTGESSGGGASAESKLSVTAGTPYTVTVGAGGAGGPASQPANGSAGSNSVFSTITSTGGGGGSAGKNGIAGGAGGGASKTYTGGAGTANQGYAGGNGNTGSGAAGGGGGGAGAIGGNGIDSGAGGAGGVGISSSITGSATFRAGGGGGGKYLSGSGGAGGNGGGGAGSANGGVPTDGTANTGGGGGGYGPSSGTARSGGAGGSGVVILRYSVSKTITIGAGLTGSTATVGGNKITTITSGTGNVSWA